MGRCLLLITKILLSIAIVAMLFLLCLPWSPWSSYPYSEKIEQRALWGDVDAMKYLGDHFSYDENDFEKAEFGIEKALPWDVVIALIA